MVLMPPAESWAALDTRVCRDTSQGDTCQVSAAATSSFLATWRGDPNFLRGVSGLVKEFAAVSPLTACVTRNLVQTLRRAFDDDHDGGVTAAESAVLVSTVAASPATAVLRLGHVLGLVSTPRYIGSCGRLAVARGGLASLRDWVGSEWAVRAELASQALALVTSLLSLEDWVLVVWDLDWADLAVTSAGQVVLVGLDKVTPVDKTLLVPGTG